MIRIIGVPEPQLTKQVCSECGPAVNGQLLSQNPTKFPETTRPVVPVPAAGVAVSQLVEKTTVHSLIFDVINVVHVDLRDDALLFRCRRDCYTGRIYIRIRNVVAVVFQVWIHRLWQRSYRA